MGKRAAQKDAIKDITSDSQVNSYFPYRASPIFNIYIYLLLYLYIAGITIQKGTSHLKSPKNQKGIAALDGVTHKAVHPGARPHVSPVMAEGDFRLMTPLYDNLQ